jgi:o-succinylbenzoate synthase
MKITQIELREIRIPLIHFFETSFGRTIERQILLVRVLDEDGNEGWGESTAGEGPFYCEEWIGGVSSVIKDYLAAFVLNREVGGAADVFNLMQRVRGNRMAKAAIETACWDLEARRERIPLWKKIGGTFREIPCGVSIGIQDSVKELITKIEHELSNGYQRIKIKIKPGWDERVVKEIRERFADINLMVDANSAYSLDDVELFREMDSYNLMMVEQPLAFDDMIEHARLQSQIKTPVCLDESIRSPEDARKAIEIGACRIINIKLGRVGGHSQARLVEEVCRTNQVPVWCGGMLETGIGRAHNIAMSTLVGFVLPGDVSASERYWKEDIITPPVTVTSNGTIIPPDKPGIGFEVNIGQIDRLTLTKETLN